MFAGYPML